MEYIAALWVSAWLIQLWTIFVPLMAMIPKDNLISQYKTLCWVVLLVLSFVLVPLMVIPMLSEDGKRRFKIHFMKGLLGED
jgi:hypothetical protein